MLSAAAPGAMEVAFCIQTFEAMGTEEVALGLDEIGGAALLPVAIEIRQGRRQGWKRQSFLRATGHDMAERRRCVLHHGHKIRCEQKIGEALVLFKGSGDGIQKLRADNAARPPDARNCGHRQIPRELL